VVAAPERIVEHQLVAGAKSFDPELDDILANTEMTDHRQHRNAGGASHQV
jgi:hypothetical protein